jgi:hypothetical protein
MPFTYENMKALNKASGCIGTARADAQASLESGDTRDTRSIEHGIASAISILGGLLRDMQGDPKEWKKKKEDEDEEG